MRWIAIGAAALLVGLLVYGVAAQGTSTTIDQALVEGRRVAAPDASLTRLGAGGPGRLEDHRGKVVLVNFWASWCDRCVEELPLLQRAHEKIGGRGGMVLGVNTR